ncbi:hypothetical protein [Candidatus Nitrospira bockiana]
MPRTALTPATPKGPYPGTVNAGDLNIALENVDNANGNVFVGNGRDLLLIQNPTAGAITFTLTSSNDPQNRKSDITNYSLGAGLFAFFWFGSIIGWAQDAAGSIYLDAGGAGLKCKVLRIP